MQQSKQMQLIHVIGYLSSVFLAVYGAVALVQDTFGLGALSWVVASPVQAESQAVAASSLQQQQDTSVPQILNYAGELRNTEGQLVSGTYTMTFRIYNDQEAEPSQALWSEERGGIVVQNGRFALVIGESKPLSPSVFNGPERYFGVSVESSDGGSPISEDTPTLRKRFAMIPFAAQAGYASALMASDGDPLNSVYVNADGNVGIGTISPSEKLEINQNGNLLLKAIDEDPGDIIFQNSAGLQKGRIWSNGTLGSALYLSSEDNVPDLTLAVGGNVGIGTIQPNNKLSVNGGIENMGTDFVLGTNLDDRGDGGRALVKGVDDTLIINFANDFAGGAYIASNLEVNGNIGVGVDNPDFKLDIGGRVRVQGEGGGNSAGIWFDDTTSSQSGFIGMNTEDTMGFFGLSAGWGLLMNTANGAVSIPNSLSVNGDFSVQGNFANFRVEGPYTLSSNNLHAQSKRPNRRGYEKTQEIGSSDKRLCFLTSITTRVSTNSSADEQQTCKVYSESGTWKLWAYAKDVAENNKTDSDVECSAMCFNWHAP